MDFDYTSGRSEESREDGLFGRLSYFTRDTSNILSSENDNDRDLMNVTYGADLHSGRTGFPAIFRLIKFNASRLEHY